MSAVNFNMRLEAELKRTSHAYFGRLWFDYASSIQTVLESNR